MTESNNSCCKFCASIIEVVNSCIDYVLGIDNYKYKKNDDIINNSIQPEEVIINMDDLDQDHKKIIENYV